MYSLPGFDDSVKKKATEFFATKILNDIFSELSGRLKQIIQNRIIEYTVETAKRCGELKTILHKESIPIDQLYFPLRIESAKRIIVPKTAEQIFQETKRVVIVGKGGSGKTTLIKYLYINCVKQNFKIPVLLNLRDLNHIDVTEIKKQHEIANNVFFKEVIVHLLFNQVGVDISTIIRLFDSGSFLFILDGYDELSYDNKGQILKDIEDFIARFPENLYVITTRPHTDATRLLKFTAYHMCGLDPETEIAPFVTQQLFNNEELAKEINATLKLSTSEKYLPLLTNPLFLILFINSFESYPKLPPKKSTFYWQVFDALFEKHETYSKSGYRRAKLSKLSKEEFEYVLNVFSYISYFRDKFAFDGIYMESLLREVRKLSGKFFEPEGFIEDLKVALCLLIEDGGRFSFIHRTLQEYFAVRFLATLDENAKKDFLEQLALKQFENHGHTFLLELISELYPYEFNQFYILAHLKYFYSEYRDVLNKYSAYDNIEHHLSADERLAAMHSFKNLNEIISYSKEIRPVFKKIVLSYQTNYNQSYPDLYESSLIDSLNSVVTMLVLHRNYENIVSDLEAHFEKSKQKNKPLIDFAFNSQDVYRNNL